MEYAHWDPQQLKECDQCTLCRGIVQMSTQRNEERTALPPEAYDGNMAEVLEDHELHHIQHAVRRRMRVRR